MINLFIWWETNDVFNMDKELQKKDEESSLKYNELVKKYVWA